MPSPHHSAIHKYNLYRVMLSPFQQHYSLFLRPSLSFSLSITLFHTEFSLTHCSSTIHSLILLPADFPPLLCPLPFTATVSAPFYLLGQRLGEKRRKKKKPFSPVSLSSPVQGLSLCWGGESKYLPHSLPHEEVLLGMVWSCHGGKKGLMGEAEDCCWTQ